jgi:hypothetical protein
VEEVADGRFEPVSLFNGPLETGVRSVVILDSAYPTAFDLAHLTWLDHLVVHTADFDGPESLHPDVPQRTGELLVRRRLVEEGLKLMARVHLVVGVSSAEGILYQATEEGTAFVDSIRSAYGCALKQRAAWLATKIAAMSSEELAALIEARIGRWAVEFQTDSPRQGTLL